LGIGNLVAGTALVGAGIAAFNALGGISGISSAVSGAVSGIKDTLFPSSDKNASDSQSTDNPATTDQTKDDSPAPTTQEDQPASPSSDDAAPLNTQDGTGTPSDPGNDGWGEG